MITYNDIYEAARNERYSESLQPILKSFISDVAVYLKDKKEVASKEDDIFVDVIVKNKKQLENAFNAGADIVVIGTAFEKDESFLKVLRK